MVTGLDLVEWQLEVGTFACLSLPGCSSSHERLHLEILFRSLKNVSRSLVMHSKRAYMPKTRETTSFQILGLFSTSQRPLQHTSSPLRLLLFLPLKPPPGQG